MTYRTTAPLGWAKRGFSYLILIAFVVVFAFPFYYVFVLATWPDSNMFTRPPHLFFGNGLAENWAHLFEELPHFWRNMVNSFAIAALATVTAMFFCTFAGFAFAMYRFKGRDLLFKLMMITFAIPATLNIIPFFRIIVAFGWINTWYPMIVPGMANAFGILLMTQYIRITIARDLVDAARIDGMSETGIVFRVVFPLVQAGVAVLAMLTFISSWNTFLHALLVLRKPEITTLPVILANLRIRSGGGTGALMLSNSIAVLPLTLALVLASKRLIAGLLEGSLKG
jgi:multiple sugar transport system permease protein